MPEHDLQKRLEKLGEQLVTDIEAWEKRTRDDRAKVLDQLTLTLEDKLGKALTKMAEKEARRQAKETRKQKRKEERRLRKASRRRRTATMGSGVISVLLGVTLAAFAVANGATWVSLLFVMLGLQGVWDIAQARRERLKEGATTQEDESEREGDEETEESAPVQPQPQAQARDEVDTLCEQLLADLAASPEAVKSFISQPERTVSTMRTTLKALEARRRQLLAEDARGRLVELERRRAQVLENQRNVSDPEAKQRMEEALGSMGGQQEALKQLQAMTERVDSEYTSLLVHLQELRTRVSVARSSGSQVQLDGVRASVQRLNDELGAISEAMEAVSRGTLTPVVPVESGGDALSGQERTRERS